jgi:hypothetical protein
MRDEPNIFKFIGEKGLDVRLSVRDAYVRSDATMTKWDRFVVISV